MLLKKGKLVSLILGISAYYHDSAACIIKDGKIIAAAQEERFTRIKHDPNFPEHAIKFCLQSINADISDLDDIVFYDKPLAKFERLLETYISYAPKGFLSFVKSMPIWLKDKLYLKSILKKELSKLSNKKNFKVKEILFTEHHRSHAASAFFPSPYESAAVMCLDGVGEWSTTSAWIGYNNKLTPLWDIKFPHSLGLLYSAFTYFCGFKVNSGEYKLMGLAPYGQAKYTDIILENLVDVKDDGTFRLNLDYFDYPVGLKMTNSKFNDLFKISNRQPESEIEQVHMDLAKSIQVVTEDIVIKLAQTLQKDTGKENLCLAGGVALNCVANGKLKRKNIFKNIWVQPASGDAGGALGSALSVWYEYHNNPRDINSLKDKMDFMQGSYLGPDYKDSVITKELDNLDAKYEYLSNDELSKKIATLLADGKVIGWHQGKMEFGPRALGGRSILGDPRSAAMQKIMNLKIKYRESFRPFAPAVKSEKVSEWFDYDSISPYMLMVAPINPNKIIKPEQGYENLFGIDKLNIPRSEIPAVTHLDYSARIQTVHKETNPLFYDLLDEFEKITNCAVLVNTSFNVRGEPIVNTPEDAFRCFMRTEMDYLVVGNYVLAKTKQDSKYYQDDKNWQKEYTLD